jgi:small subunit ribosomal protein S3
MIYLIKGGISLGQKTNPIGFRLGITTTWNSRWFSKKKDCGKLLKEDLMIRKYVKQRLLRAGVSKIEIERTVKRVDINIHTSRPGIVIGKKGSEVDKLRDELNHITKKEVFINIQEIKKPDIEAQLVAENIAFQIEGRLNHRRVMKKAVFQAMKMGAQGAKVICGGRLAGAEMARRESYHEGRVPLHTLRADIDYAIATAHTTYGCVGIKVWIFKGFVFDKNKKTKDDNQ